MNAKEFFGKFLSGYLWGHLLAMAAVVVLLCLGVKFGLDLYTHHGQGIPVPNLKGMQYNAARQLIEDDGLVIIVSDSGYNKRMPADCILAQTPGYGAKVKQGHIVYVTVNSPSSPTFAIPDIVDNSSLREAEARLMAMGFKLLPPQRVVGEKDWVYGILCRGRRISNGDRVAIDQPLTLMIGSGGYEDEGDDYGYAGGDEQPSEPANGEVDDFEEVTGPPVSEDKMKDSGLNDF
ncbi:MAG: PASTA domain-containing protein [Prevotella sp.]|nr:PASTA domain-containing protein [Prevotella sp.]